MKKYPFGAILDFWENYKSMIVTEKINLIDTKICVISKMESKNKDGIARHFRKKKKKKEK